jgi:hypothetical protein
VGAAVAAAVDVGHGVALAVGATVADAAAVGTVVPVAVAPAAALVADAVAQDPATSAVLLAPNT